MATTAAEQWKNKGNGEYAAKNYMAAIQSYSKAIEMNPSSYINRSAAFAGLGQYDKSLLDAQKSLQLNSNWVKGYFRSGIAYFEMKRFEEAFNSFQRACQIEPANEELKSFLRKADQARKQYQSQQQVPQQQFQQSKPPVQPSFPTSFPQATPQQQYQPQPQPKPLPQQPQSQQQYQQPVPQQFQPSQPQSQSQPQTQQAPRPTSSSNNPAQRAKEEGNELFKAGKIPQAIEAYSKAIELATDPNDKATIYSNRAACFVQLYEPTKVVADCTECLNIQPDNQKALIRRGLAYESLEKYKLALEDLQKVINKDPSVSVASQALNRIKAGLRAQGQM